MTDIRQEDLIQSVADALQFISYYHPADYIAALGEADQNRGLMVSNLGSLSDLRNATSRRVLDYRGVSNRNGGLFALGLHFAFIDGVRMMFNFTRPLTPDDLAISVADATISNLEGVAVDGWDAGSDANRLAS